MLVARERELVQNCIGFWAFGSPASSGFSQPAICIVVHILTFNKNRRRLQSLFVSQLSTVIFGIVSTAVYGLIRVTLKQVGVVRLYITGIANATKKAECMYILSSLSHRLFMCVE